ncbi:MAG: hypothetical protein ABI690_17030 [Chloroflexota bacterium]
MTASKARWARKFANCRRYCGREAQGTPPNCEFCGAKHGGWQEKRRHVCAYAAGIGVALPLREFRHCSAGISESAAADVTEISSLSYRDERSKTLHSKTVFLGTITALGKSRVA